MGAIGLAKSLAVAAFAELAMLAAGVADVLCRTARVLAFTKCGPLRI